MKKYRLIKEYPGSPKLGFEVDLKQISTEQFCWQEETEIWGKSRTKSHFIIDVLNSPNFWEEIIEKEYEILSYRANIGGYIYTKKDMSHEFHRYSDPDHANILHIYSIKRLSDNTIWTIGDSCTNRESTTIRTIKEFFEKGSKVRYTNGEWDLLTTIQVCKRVPILTTEDGVDVFEEDIYCFVHLDNTTDPLHITPRWNVMISTNRGRLALGNPGIKRFSTKEKAEEFIILNKPCLSMAEVLKATTSYTFSPFGQKVKELVKSKLNIK